MRMHPYGSVGNQIKKLPAIGSTSFDFAQDKSLTIKGGGLLNSIHPYGFHSVQPLLGRGFYPRSIFGVQQFICGELAEPLLRIYHVTKSPQL
jgi:hypothetical protein